MKTRLINLWDKFSNSFWFVPTVFVLLAALVGYSLPAIERNHWMFWAEMPSLKTAPAGARTVLSVIAGAMITVAGVIFSVMMATLSIASSQFGSRVLRQNMRSRATQLSLGTFLGTSIYCFLVLRSVGQGSDGTFVPDLSIALAIAATVLSVFVLIYFIHDVAESVQAPFVVARLAADLNDSIERLFPEELGTGGDELEGEAKAAEERLESKACQLIESSQEGYLQAVSGETLLEQARHGNAVIKLVVRPGEFLAQGEPIARVWFDDAHPRDLTEPVNEALLVGPTRTPRQDVNCGIHELAQLTVRALSPGINDPFTAMNGIDRLSAALGRLALRKIPSRYRFDDAHQLRVIVDHVTFPEALAAAFNHVRQNISSSTPVGVRLLESLEVIVRKAPRKEDRDAILQQAQLVVDAYQNSHQLDADMRVVHTQFARIQVLTSDFPGQDVAPVEADGAGQQATHSPTEQADEDAESQPPSIGEING